MYVVQKITCGFQGSDWSEEAFFEVPCPGATDSEIEDLVSRIKGSDYVTNRLSTPITDRPVMKYGSEQME